jgi:hypothetical protein
MTCVAAVRLRPTPPATRLHRDTHAVIGLEAVDRGHPLLYRFPARDRHCRGAERLSVAPEAFGEAGEHDDLAAGGKHIPDPFGHGRLLRLVKRHPELREPTQERRIVRAGHIRLREPFGEGTLGLPGRGAVDLDGHPRADLGRQVEHLILFPALQTMQSKFSCRPEQRNRSMRRMLNMCRLIQQQECWCGPAVGWKSAVGGTSRRPAMS